MQGDEGLPGNNGPPALPGLDVRFFSIIYHHICIRNGAFMLTANDFFKIIPQQQECYLPLCQGPPGEMGAQGSPGPPGAPVSNPEPS